MIGSSTGDLSWALEPVQESLQVLELNTKPQVWRLDQNIPKLNLSEFKVLRKIEAPSYCLSQSGEISASGYKLYAMISPRLEELWTFINSASVYIPKI